MQLKWGDMQARQGGVLVEYRQSVTHINQFPIAIKKDLDTVFQDEVIDRLVNELDIGRRETKTLLSYLHNVETAVRYNLCHTLGTQHPTGYLTPLHSNAFPSLAQPSIVSRPKRDTGPAKSCSGD